MPEIDPTAFDNIFSVLALLILTGGVVAMKWLSTMKRENTETKDQVNKLVTSVTENNGGSSVKDQLDRLESKLDDHLSWSDRFVAESDARIAALEADDAQAAATTAARSESSETLT